MYGPREAFKSTCSLLHRAARAYTQPMFGIHAMSMRWVFEDRAKECDDDGESRTMFCQCLLNSKVGKWK